MTRPQQDHATRPTAPTDHGCPSPSGQRRADVAAALRQAHRARRMDLAETLTSMLLPAGALGEWDSETIEHVLEPAATVLHTARLPWIGSESGHQFWAPFAWDDAGEHDWPHTCPGCGLPLAPEPDAVRAAVRKDTRLDPARPWSYDVVPVDADGLRDLDRPSLASGTATTWPEAMT